MSKTISQKNNLKLKMQKYFDICDCTSRSCIFFKKKERKKTNSFKICNFKDNFLKEESTFLLKICNHKNWKTFE